MKLTRRATWMQEASIITEQVFAAYASELFPGTFNSVQIKCHPSGIPRCFKNRSTTNYSRRPVKGMPNEIPMAGKNYWPSQTWLNATHSSGYLNRPRSLENLFKDDRRKGPRQSWQGPNEMKTTKGRELEVSTGCVNVMFERETWKTRICGRWTRSARYRWKER